MNVKTIKDFEKELGMSLKLKEKQVPILQEYCQLARLIYGKELRMVVIIGLTYSDRKKRLFKLITLYKEFFELVESVQNLNKKVTNINKLKEEDDN